MDLNLQYEFKIIYMDAVVVGGYLLMFLSISFVGPGVTAAGAFAAKLGYFNVWIVFLVSVLGNLVPDILLYAAGFFGRTHLIDKYGHYIGVTQERMRIIENLYRKYAVKTLVISKLLPFAAVPGLIAAGAVRMSIKKYTFWSLAVILTTSGGFLALGYYFGAVYERFADYEAYVFALVAMVIVVISYGYKKLTKKLFHF